MNEKVLAMWQTLAWTAATFAWGLLLSSSKNRKLITKNPDEEKFMTRRWIGACVTVLVLGTLGQALMALERHAAMSSRTLLPKLSTTAEWDHTLIGVWFLPPMLWFFLDWDRWWPRIVISGAQQGYSTQGTVTLLRIVSGASVGLNLAMLIISGLGFEQP